MKFQLEKMLTQKFVYMRRVGAYGKENAELMRKFKSLAAENKWLNSESVIYGIAKDDPQTTRPEKCRYDVGMTVQDEFKFEDFENGIIPGGDYLTFKIEHTEEAVQAFWNMIFGWLKKEGHQWDDRRDILERYAFNLVEQGYCEFCVPIK